MELMHASLAVSDEADSRAFYEDVLGFESRWEFEDGDGNRNFYLDHPDSDDDEPDFQMKVVDGEVDQRGLDHLAIEVPDVDAIAEELPAERVLDEPADMDGYDLRVAHVADPDGYRVELIEFLE